MRAGAAAKERPSDVAALEKWRVVVAPVNLLQAAP
jgi:hypothetical protein